MSDPWEIPGLAHFCEHMLFLGTEKYPEENEYSKYLSENGGYSNAFTADDQTNYHFEVSPSALQGALDRFAAFFHSPLFTESATTREINAVNSENDKNLQADIWRINQLRRSTQDPNHDFAKFGTGNTETLSTIPTKKGMNVRDELLKFHSKYYSANMMSLAIVGKEPIDVLKSYVVDLFSDVKDFNAKRPEWWDKHPMRPEDAGQFFSIVPIKDVHNLSLQFGTDDPRDHYKAAPYSYLSHLIGHEGPGSLLSELKSRGWVNSLAAGNYVPATGFGFFGVEMELSEEGTNHVNEIIKLFFQYVEMVKRANPQKWIFDEEGELKKVKFRFKDKDRPTDAVVNLTSSLHVYPVEDAIYGPYSMEDYKPDLITNSLERLNPSNMRIDFVSKKVEEKADKTEKWYGTRYHQEKIDEQVLNEWKKVDLNDKFKLPEKNEFIPTDFSIATNEREQSMKVPELISNTGMSYVWYRGDGEFKLPKAYLKWHIFSPYSYADPRSIVLTQLFSQIFSDELNEYAYNADLAGLRYHLDATVSLPSYFFTFNIQLLPLFVQFHGIGLQIFGYSHKQQILLDKILDKMCEFNPDPARFKVIKEAFIRNLQNFRAEQPYRHAVYYTAVCSSDTRWTNAEMLQAIEPITVEDLKQFLPHLLSKISVESFMYGNIPQSKAVTVGNHVEKRLREAFHSAALPDNQMRFIREVELPRQSAYIFTEENKVHSNNAIDMIFQLGPESKRGNVQLELLHQIIHEPAFDELRTKQQLGYIVHTSVRRSHGCQSFQVIIQSDRDCATLEQRCTEFFDKFLKDLENMTEEQFKQHIEALAVRRLEKSKKMAEEASRVWSEINSRWYHFNRGKILILSNKAI